MAEYVLYGVENGASKFIIKISNSIEEIDKFTMCFYDSRDMGLGLNELYKNKKFVKIDYLYLVRKDKNKEGIIPIRYKDNNYDEVSVIETYKEALWPNSKLLMKSNVKHVNLDFMRRFKETGKICFGEREFSMAIHAYFYNGGKISYSKVREAYFELLELGKKTKCKKR